MVRPFRGKISVGMKFQCVRSSPSKANVACCRCSGVRLSRNFVAAAAIAAEDGPAVTVKPNADTIRIAPAIHRVVVRRVMSAWPSAQLPVLRGRQVQPDPRSTCGARGRSQAAAAPRRRGTRTHAGNRRQTCSLRLQISPAPGDPRSHRGAGESCSDVRCCTGSSECPPAARATCRLPDRAAR